MTFNAEQTQAWSSADLDRVRSELTHGYQRMEQTVAGEADGGNVMTHTMLTGAQLAVERAHPTWLSSSSVNTLTSMLTAPAMTDSLIADGHYGFLIFERPIAQTTLGSAEPSGVAPINGLVWWAAEFDGHGFRHESQEPNIVVVHALSTRVSSELPWQPMVWEDSELTDLGMFPLPLAMEMTPPTVTQDDLAPAIGLLFAYGQAVESGRVLYADVEGCSPRRPIPREVAVVYPDAG
ncbi:hypothetical protein [Gordonia hydrophobica]|uniref:Uncharacterized protein n=1 Tax=Gordonia hydrophobica TaxID=40516 RepID=A0ABZ2U2U2_9ACTN|nr:hypothetical protein [Gordonia hydrophobica]MBM7369409.1 hypothetical protein [Gordonia hydrophobica]